MADELSASMSRAIRARGSMARPYAPAPAGAAGRGPGIISLRAAAPGPDPVASHAAYRRLYVGFTLSNVGSQLAVVAIGLQVYEITRSTAAVGIVGFFALVPLVVMGLYGGTLVDHYDRRRWA